MDYSALKSEVEQKTAQTLEVLQNEFAGLRTGRASVHFSTTTFCKTRTHV